MNCPIFHMDSSQQMEQLYFGKGVVMMRLTIRRTLEGMGVHNGNAIFHMDVHIKRNAAVIRDKEHRQQPFQIFCHY